MSDKKFDRAILGGMQACLDFISDILWPPSLLLCMFFVASPMSLAAQTTSLVEGTVLDTQGGAIVGA